MRPCLRQKKSTESNIMMHSITTIMDTPIVIPADMAGTGASRLAVIKKNCGSVNSLSNFALYTFTLRAFLYQKSKGLSFGRLIMKTQYLCTISMPCLLYEFSFRV